MIRIPLKQEEGSSSRASNLKNNFSRDHDVESEGDISASRDFDKLDHTSDASPEESDFEGQGTELTLNEKKRKDLLWETNRYKFTKAQDELLIERILSQPEVNYTVDGLK